MRSLWLARILGALALLVVGAVHLQQFLSLYSEIPTIGTLFVLNFAGATVIGLGLLSPVERLPGTQEKTGKVTGDGFSDAFGGRQFTWHVVHGDNSSRSSGGAMSAGQGSPGY
jgi:hypothetical protein